MNTPHSLDLLDLGWALGLVAIAIALLQWQKIGIAGRVIIASSRAMLQLLVLGFGLQSVWQLDRPEVTIGAIGLLAIATAIAASNRISDRVTGLLPIVSGAILTSLIVAVGYTILVVIKPDNWHQPQYLLAYAGISLGYLLASTAIAGERLISEIEGHQAEIETHLSLGATPAQAIASYRRAAIEVALLPTIETLMVAGLVTIPGFLTGELLGNLRPMNAAGYQIIALFTTLASNTIATLLVTQGIANRYFNRQDRLITPE